MEQKEKYGWPDWETVQLIGNGSFGSVYKIKREVLGITEWAALKVISIPQKKSDIEEMYGEGYDEQSVKDAFQEQLKEIVNEYAFMRKLYGSANIVNCDDVRYEQHEDGIGWNVFIKMELLTPLLKTNTGDNPEKAAVKLGKDICAALTLCKKHGIIHRDIKPQNIFLSDNGDYKLGDFGVAKATEKTARGTKVGTYRYMAPEVCFGKPYGASADIYSLGLVMYWMLNEHRMPFMPLPPKKLDSIIEEQAKTRRLSGEPVPPPAFGNEELKKLF